MRLFLGAEAGSIASIGSADETGVVETGIDVADCSVDA